MSADQESANRHYADVRAGVREVLASNARRAGEPCWCWPCRMKDGET